MMKKKLKQILKNRLSLLAVGLIFINSLNAQTTGNALHFDGVNDDVNAGNISEANFGTGNFTIEFWIKTSTYPSSNADIVSKRTICDPANFWNLKLNNDGRIFYEAMESGGANTALISSSAIIADGSWHHFAVTRSSGYISLYIDGLLDNGQSFGNTNLNNSDPVRLGIGACSEFPWGGYFEGALDELRFWNVARTASEISNNMDDELGPQSGLFAVYHFNQGVAGGNNTSPLINTAVDNSGNSYTGSLNGFALNGPISNWVNGNVATSCDDFTVYLRDSNFDVLAGGSLEYREGGGSGWQTATELSDGLFCIDTQRSKVGLRMTYGPQVQKVGGVSTGSNYTFQTVHVTVALEDAGSPVDGGMVKYTSGGWHAFGETGDDGTGTGTTSKEMLPVQYTFQMKYDGNKENKTEVISTSNNLITFEVDDLKSSELDGAEDFQLVAYPNPFSGNATIAFSLEATEEVTISIFNINGKLIEIIQNGVLTEGNHKLEWNASDAQKGIYIVRVNTDRQVHHKNIVKM